MILIAQHLSVAPRVGFRKRVLECFVLLGDFEKHRIQHAGNGVDQEGKVERAGEEQATACAPSRGAAVPRALEPS